MCRYCVFVLQLLLRWLLSVPPIPPWLVDHISWWNSFSVASFSKWSPSNHTRRCQQKEDVGQTVTSICSTTIGSLDTPFHWDDSEVYHPQTHQCCRVLPPIGTTLFSIATQSLSVLFPVHRRKPTIFSHSLVEPILERLRQCSTLHWRRTSKVCNAYSSISFRFTPAPIELEHRHTHRGYVQYPWYQYWSH